MKISSMEMSKNYVINVTYCCRSLCWFHQCPVLNTTTSAPFHRGARASMAASWSADCTRLGGRPRRRTRYGERKCSTVQLWSRNRYERKPLCLVMGFPFSSYTGDEPPSASATAVESMHSMDSHWLRPIESPTNTSRTQRCRGRRAACRALAMSIDRRLLQAFTAGGGASLLGAACRHVERVSGKGMLCSLVLPFLCARHDDGCFFPRSVGLRGRNKGWMVEESAGRRVVWE
jgi:hypothetical protein